MKLNLNKILPFLSIRSKLIVAFSLLSFIPLLIIGSLAIYYNFSTMRENAVVNLKHDLDLVSERARNYLSNIKFDIRLISQSPVLKEYIENLYKDENKSRQPLENQLQAFLLTKTDYYQIRLIDSYSNERIRIQYISNKYRILPDEDLSESSFRYYFLLTDSLKAGEMTFMPVELFSENLDGIPAISFASRLFNSNNVFSGILIIDIYASGLFKVLEESEHSDTKHNLAIVNNEGNYLYHSEQKNYWNRLLASRDNINLFNDYSESFWKKIISGNNGIIDDEFQEIAVFAPLFETAFQAGNSYFIFESVKRSDIYGPVQRNSIIFVGMGSLFLIIAIFLGVLATKQIAGPIDQLQKGAEIVSMGNYTHKIHIETNDEIEQLGNRFNEMAKALEIRENKLENQQKVLETMVKERTAELNNEKEKLQAILDHVPSALLLLDKDKNIISASQSVKKIAGIRPESLMGKKCFQLFKDQKQCKYCPHEGFKEKMGIHVSIDEHKSESGEIIFIEHFIIPLHLENKNFAALEIVSDITERKHLEQHLIRTEKLAATGEMSAIIAHEMRNSLTSVKMIMQLLYETSNSDEDKNSLEVAIQSILNMEKVVNNLLRFSRPEPYKFKNEDLNGIINESIAFTRPQIDNKNIKLIVQTDQKIPHIKVDAHHLRDVFVNLIINSIQAVGQNGKIDIVTQKIKLRPESKEKLLIEDIEKKQSSGKSYNKLSAETEVIRIQITDNGTGIANENKGKIFDPFFTTKLDGTGLGLPIVKRTINDHNGIIHIGNNPTNGTCVQIFLPLTGKV